jgi:hypothetical protein
MGASIATVLGLKNRLKAGSEMDLPCIFGEKSNYLSDRLLLLI